MKSEFYTSGEKVNKIYNALNNNLKRQFGEYKKCIFHLHTPASHDYKLVEKNSEEESALELDAKKILEIIIEKNIIPSTAINNIEEIKYNEKIYNNLKEYLSYYLVAAELIKSEIEIVVITDHNTILGYKKLKKAIEDNWNLKRGKKYPEVLCGIEISCADKNHIVGIFDINSKLENKINEWISEYIMSDKEGTYLSSVDVLKQIASWGGIGYIAHIDTSDLFKENYLSGAYKKVLFNLNGFSVIGVKNINRIEDIKKRINTFSKKEFSFVVDEDSHCIEEIGSKVFWIKGVDSDYKTIKKAIRDYNISVELQEPSEPNGYIKGMYLIKKDEGFLSGKEGNGDFVITFSNSLNCFIGGRGTGKSTALQILDFVLGQNYVKENRIEQICGNKEIWVLYSKNKTDYLVLFNPPLGEYNDFDSAVNQFRREIKRDYNLTANEICKNIQKKYIQVFKLKMNRNVLEQKEIFNVSDILSSFFDTKYSVNELVQYASTEEISNYVKSTIQKNTKITKIKLPAYVRTMKGLQKKVFWTKELLAERKKEIMPILEDYNKLHKKDIQIQYDYKKTIDQVLNFEKLFLFSRGSMKQWFYKFNITNRNVVGYFEALHDELGTVKMLEIISSNDLCVFNDILPLTSYTELQTFRMVENDITIIDNNNVKMFFDIILKILNRRDNVDLLSWGLRYYVENCEYYNLLFNINNKENIDTAKNIFKPIGKLSMGQKVVAMLSFVLSYSDFSNDYRPLIIDQPEDNLDNQYIYKNLVKQLRKVKSKRQVIIATHSATIVTNAKAEQVIVMESDNEHGWVKAAGYPNEKRIIKHIINNLEGGVESFEHKCFIYADVLIKK